MRTKIKQLLTQKKDHVVQNIPGFDEQKTLLFNNFLHLMFFNIF